ncbi:hypothetical protein [Nitrosarchaeum sp. AC2]|nr:hypothetical protein [Nitrosarchaeum sp. AC2]
MKGFCSRCKEDRGEDQEWGIFFKSFPFCKKCGGFVDLEDE